MSQTLGDLAANWPYRVWTIETTDGEKISGYLPVWAEGNPSKTGVAPDRLAVELADITHEVSFGGQSMRVRHGIQEPPEDSAVFVPYMQCRPFAEDGADASEPRVSIQIADDLWIPDLNPAEVADFADKLRVLHNLLIGTVVPTLITAHVDWHERHPMAPPSPWL